MLRPATDDDCADVLRWRNHPEVRAVSLTQHEITEEEHAAYWAATKATDAREIYMYVRHGVPSGVVTYFDIDRDGASAWWGYYLDNDGLTERGELLPAWIEIQRQAKRLAFDELGLEVLEGEVLEANEAVRRFNRRNGFEEVERYIRDIDGVETPVLRVRATKDR
ncbi:peptide chain release factor 2 [Intrasporangium oryzae NRRL B-24470]|uniref:Peptide chain release factor 2 n=1 Tax=Intrasporangium oryzae NRRL B-24470 TaxID=1386089 RepID=W9G8J1_9MICO|nr:GNAT family N-acetyltransferase [Intrasporangium oryzae]EWT01143.1 peptide chain release factor 2 [Intrasporangium oryzae NRRL B-24470]